MAKVFCFRICKSDQIEKRSVIWVSFYLKAALITNCHVQKVYSHDNESVVFTVLKFLHRILFVPDDLALCLTTFLNIVTHHTIFEVNKQAQVLKSFQNKFHFGTAFFFFE